LRSSRVVLNRFFMEIEDAKQEIRELIRYGKVAANCTRGVYPTPSELGEIIPIRSILGKAEGEWMAQMIAWYLADNGDQFGLIDDSNQYEQIRNWLLKCEDGHPARNMFEMMVALKGPNGAIKVIFEWLPKAAPHLATFETAAAFSRNWAKAMQMLPAKEA